ncbi:glycosyltransferase, partial [Patescibacteria group bacterium]|nr:glycosyltransferase [Patescibacteria group bacterium]
MNNKTKISIVIPNWNRAEDTIECLESVGELRVADYELGIVVVDNGSTDDSVEKIEEKLILLKEKNIHSELIRNEENLGFAAGNN